MGPGVGMVHQVLNKEFYHYIKKNSTTATNNNIMSYITWYAYCCTVLFSCVSFSMVCVKNNVNQCALVFNSYSLFYYNFISCSNQIL